MATEPHWYNRDWVNMGELSEEYGTLCVRRRVDVDEFNEAKFCRRVSTAFGLVHPLRIVGLVNANGASFTRYDFMFIPHNEDLMRMAAAKTDRLKLHICYYDAVLIKAKLDDINLYPREFTEAYPYTGNSEMPTLEIAVRIKRASK